MGRGLLTLGSCLLVLTVGLWVADSAGWVPPGSCDRPASLAWKIGLSVAAAGLLLRVLNPVRNRLATGRCVSCGSAVLPGHLYCSSHLQDSVNTWRDQARDRVAEQAKTRR